MPNVWDPVAFDRYAYVMNSPIMYIDPSGHCPTGEYDDICSDSYDLWTPDDLNDLFRRYGRPAEDLDLSEPGLDFILQQEDFVPRLYNDGLTIKDEYFYDTAGNGVGHCTIGYGYLVHTGPCDGREEELPFMDGITEEEALQLVLDTVNEIEKMIEEVVTVPVTQGMFDALVSLLYNWPLSRLKLSDKLKFLNQGNYIEAGLHWNEGPFTSDGVWMEGLYKRRNAEKRMFFQIPQGYEAIFLPYFNVDLSDR